MIRVFTFFSLIIFSASLFAAPPVGLGASRQAQQSTEKMQDALNPDRLIHKDINTSNILYNQENNCKKKVLLNEEIFSDLKKDLKVITSKYRKNFSTLKDYNSFLSKIGVLNRVNKNETKEKLSDLFKYANVELTDQLKSLISIERNSAVHEGKFGNSNKEMYINYFVLDHAIRDIILNIIKYNGNRYKQI